MRLTPEQLAARRTGLGSTDLIQIAGLAPWEGAGPMRVFVEKRGIELPEKGDEEAKAWGHTMEPVIANWYAKQRGVELLPAGTFQLDSHPLIFVTPDFKIVGLSRGLEIKNVSSFMGMHWDKGDADGIPDYVRAQVSIQCYGGPYEDADICASISGTAPHIWTMAADTELAERLIDMGEKFWRDHVEKDAPPVDQRDSDAFRAWLSARYPQPPERVVIDVDPSTRLHDLAIERVECAAAVVKAEARKRTIDAQLMSDLGLQNADSFKFDGVGAFSWRRQKNTGDRRMPRFNVKSGKGARDDDA